MEIQASKDPHLNCPSVAFDLFLEKEPDSYYNYRHFSAAYFECEKFEAPEMGHKLPDISFYSLDGSTTRLSDLTGKKIILEIASLTSPVFFENLDKMEKLSNIFWDYDFCIVYVREEHPGKKIPHHQTLEQKMQNARHLKSRVDNGWSILVDNLTGDGHRVLGQMPNSCFLIDKERTVLYRASSTDPSSLHTKLAGLLLSQSDSSSTGIVVPKPTKIRTTLRVLSAAGSDSVADCAFSLPKILSKRRRMKERSKAPGWD